MQPTKDDLEITIDILEHLQETPDIVIDFMQKAGNTDHPVYVELLELYRFLNGRINGLYQKLNDL